MEAYTRETIQLDPADIYAPTEPLDQEPQSVAVNIIGALTDDRIFAPIVKLLLLASCIGLLALAWRLGAGACIVAALVILLACDRARGLE